jgi:hypothetical protein
MIMPGTVGDRWPLEFQKLHQFFLLGLFIYTVFTALSKSAFIAKRNSS